MGTLLNLLIVIYCIWFVFGGGKEQIKKHGFKSVVESVWTGQEAPDAKG